MVKNSNKPCDKGCFVDTRMFPSNAACANNALPWERRRTTLGGLPQNLKRQKLDEPTEVAETTMRNVSETQGTIM